MSSKSKGRNLAKKRRQTRHRTKNSIVTQIGSHRQAKMHYGDGPNAIKANERRSDEENKV